MLSGAMLLDGEGYEDLFEMVEHKLRKEREVPR